MANKIFSIKKKIDFINVTKSSKTYKSKSLILRKLYDNNLNNSSKVGYMVTKKLGNAVKRNRAKRIMRELARKVITKYGKINSYYVLIAKSSIFEIPFDFQENELKKLIS